MRPLPERPASRLPGHTGIPFPTRARGGLVLAGLVLATTVHANTVQPMGDKARSPAAQAAFKTCMSTELKAHGGTQAVSGAQHRQIALKCDASAGK
ncbi:hypothetical protein KHC28_15530 [Ancylobacter sonchi]|uniref:hypothetical protein n=1 Tax=Ancylobacter sonchi TaxID=1937790 RepID=UPI001BD3D7DA|nr:hypothetical protein [Ancylobacter sonchi]MBS7535065.1 hypothetical protein [Ancylobacter sonchi]